MTDYIENGKSIGEMSEEELRDLLARIKDIMPRKELEDFEKRIASLKDDIADPSEWVPLLFRHIMVTMCQYPPESDIRQRAFDAYLDALPHVTREWNKVVYDTFALSRDDISADERNKLFIHTGQNLKKYLDDSLSRAEVIMGYSPGDLVSYRIDRQAHKDFIASCMAIFPDMAQKAMNNSLYEGDVKRCLRRTFGHHAEVIRELSSDGAIDPRLVDIFNGYRSEVTTPDMAMSQLLDLSDFQPTLPHLILH